MKVKINDKIYDSKDGPIMLILDKEDKDFISQMEKKSFKYCVYPDLKKYARDNYKIIKEFMKT